MLFNEKHMPGSKLDSRAPDIENPLVERQYLHAHLVAIFVSVYYKRIGHLSTGSALLRDTDRVVGLSLECTYAPVPLR